MQLLLHYFNTFIKDMETLTIQPATKEQVKIFESLAKALNVPIKKTSSKSPYNKGFVAKIKQSDKNFSAGRFKAVKPEDLWK